jgi:hypothetical protein
MDDGAAQFLELVTSTKGRPKAAFRGHMYTRNSSHGESTYWRCERRPECKAALTALTGSSRVSKLPSQHSHNADAARRHVVWARGRARELALEAPGTDPAVLHGQLLEEAGAGGEAVARETTAGKLKRTIRHARNAADGAPRVPGNQDEMDIPQRYRDYINLAGVTEDCLKYYGKGPLAARQGDGDEAFLIFASDRGLALLGNGADLHCDGTWSVAPTGWMQCYSFHSVKQFPDSAGDQRQVTLPAAYCLLQRKNETTYKRVLEQLKLLAPDLNPASLLTDMEDPFLNAFGTAFPHCPISLCYFHLTQAVRRFADSEAGGGLKARLEADVDLSVWLGCLPALSFVPEHAVLETYALLQERLPESLALVDAYFERNFLGVPFGRRRERRRPRHRMDHWNQTDRAAEKKSCTNNAVEASHRRLQVAMRVRHPSVWLFIDELKKLLRCDDARAVSLQSGAPADKPAPKYRQRAQRLANLVRNFPAGDDERLGYLRAISHCHKI